MGSGRTVSIAWATLASPSPTHLLKASILPPWPGRNSVLSLLLDFFPGFFISRPRAQSGSLIPRGHNHPLYPLIQGLAYPGRPALNTSQHLVPVGRPFRAAVFHGDQQPATTIQYLPLL